MNPVLIGYRCCGKTTLGKALAKALDKTFIDTDERVQERVGRSIEALVADQGWEAFRSLESRTLARALEERNAVIATGGGIILDPENRKLIREKGWPIWLYADAATIVQRLISQKGDHRPRLTEAASLEEETRQMLELRTPLYNDTAALSIDTTTETLEGAIREIQRRLDHGRF